MQPFAPVGPITPLFGIEGVSAPLERLSGSTLPAFITQGGYSSVEKVILKDEKLSKFLPELRPPFDQFVFPKLAFFAFIPENGPVAWFINAHWQIGDSCGLLYEVLNKLLGFENPSINLSANFGVDHSWTTPLAIHSFTLEGDIMGSFDPKAGHLDFTAIRLRLFGIRGMEYKPEPQSTLEYGFEISGNVDLGIPNSSDQFDFVIREIYDAVQLSCSIVGDIWSAPLGINGLTVSESSYSIAEICSPLIPHSSSEMSHFLLV